MADEEELELDVNQTKGNKTTTILLIVLIVLVLVMGGVGAWLFMSKDGDSSNASDKSQSADKTHTEDKKDEELKPLIYTTLVPEFVVNFGSGSKVRYLQVDLQIASRDQNATDIVNTYRPVIRNDILVLLSGLSFEELRMRDGKEALQKKILNTVNRIVADAMHSNTNHEAPDENATGTAKGDGHQNEKVEGPIENIYFTSFIMQ